MIITRYGQDNVNMNFVDEIDYITDDDGWYCIKFIYIIEKFADYWIFETKQERSKVSNWICDKFFINTDKLIESELANES